MVKFSTYLVCKEHINEVKQFLELFFKEEKTKFNHPEWITFKIPDSKFTINLMTGDKQQLTQNTTFEIECESMEELEQYAKKYNQKIQNFLATAVTPPYRFYFIEIPGPHGICKVDISRSEKEV